MKLHRFILPFAALSLGALSACGSLGGEKDGGLTGLCSADSQCATGEICHPTAKVCAKTCTSSSDCPSSAKTCDVPVGAADGGTTKVCQCATTQLCNGGMTGDLVCATHDKVCVDKCTGNTDCPSGRTCDTATGQCSAPMMMTETCTFGSCSGGKVCDLLTSTCKEPATCVMGNVQPDVCGYAGYCNAGTCSEISAPTCGNFPTNAAARTWNPSTQQGPVIYSITKLAFVVDDTFCCGMGMTCAINKRAKVHVQAYHPGGMLLGQTMQPSLQNYREDMTPIAIAATQIQSYMSSNSGKNASFDVNFCTATANSSLTIALTYDNGNGACFTVN